MKESGARALALEKSEVFPPPGHRAQLIVFASRVAKNTNDENVVILGCDHYSGSLHRPASVENEPACHSMFLFSRENLPLNKNVAGSDIASLHVELVVCTSGNHYTRFLRFST